MVSAKELGRSRLDSSLLAPALSQRAHLLELVRKQLSGSPVLDKNFHAWTKESIDKASEKRASEIFSFLESLRTARQEVLDNKDEKSSRAWKIKEETDLMRVMYRPGAEGTPYHTYCVEGIVNGPMVDALCVSWEAPSYRTWWPQFNMPTFKVVESKWVKRIRVGEDLSYIRVKVPWPLAAREVLMTEFELEYFDDDIVIVVIGTAPSDPDEVEEEIYGFSGDELPPVTQGVVRMEVTGGFILQKITEDQSFFRTLVDMDMKLDYVPPWIINFITRQLVGSGYKQYQKAVLSAKEPSGKVFQELLRSEPLYRRIKAGPRRSKHHSEKSKHKHHHHHHHHQDQTPAEILPAISSSSSSKDKEKDKEELAGKFRKSLSSRRELREPREPALEIDAEVERALQVLDKMIELVRDWKSSQAALAKGQRSLVELDSRRSKAGEDEEEEDEEGEEEENGERRCFGRLRRSPSTNGTPSSSVGTKLRSLFQGVRDSGVLCFRPASGGGPAGAPPASAPSCCFR